MKQNSLFNSHFHKQILSEPLIFFHSFCIDFTLRTQFKRTLSKSLRLRSASWSLLPCEKKVSKNMHGKKKSWSFSLEAELFGTAIILFFAFFSLWNILKCKRKKMGGKSSSSQREGFIKIFPPRPLAQPPSTCGNCSKWLC